MCGEACLGVVRGLGDGRSAHPLSPLHPKDWKSVAPSGSSESCQKRALALRDTVAPARMAAIRRAITDHTQPADSSIDSPVGPVAEIADPRVSRETRVDCFLRMAMLEFRLQIPLLCQDA